MKKFLVIIFLFIPFIIGHAEDIAEAQIEIEELPQYVESPVSMSIQLLRPTNGLEADRELNVYGSIVASDYSFYNAVAILFQIGEDSELHRIALNSPGFKTNINLDNYNYGELQLLVYAVGDFSEETEPAEELIFASNSVSFERVLKMRTEGWIFMISIWSAIIALAVFTFTKIFSIRKEKIVEPLEVDTGDDSY